MSHRRDGPNPFKTPLELPKEPVGSVGAAAWAPPPQSPPSLQPPPAPTGASGGLQSAVAEMLHCGNLSIAAATSHAGGHEPGKCPTLPFPAKPCCFQTQLMVLVANRDLATLCCFSPPAQPLAWLALWSLYPHIKPTPSDSLVLAHQEGSPHPALRRQEGWKQFYKVNGTREHHFHQWLYIAIDAVSTDQAILSKTLE